MYIYVFMYIYIYVYIYTSIYLCIYIYASFLWHPSQVAFYCEDEGNREDFEGVGPTNLPTTNDGPNPTYADPIHSIDHLPPKSYENQPKSPLMRTKNRVCNECLPDYITKMIEY